MGLTGCGDAKPTTVPGPAQSLSEAPFSLSCSGLPFSGAKPSGTWPTQGSCSACLFRPQRANRIEAGGAACLQGTHASRVTVPTTSAGPART